MDAFSATPNEIHLELLLLLAKSDVASLYNLIRASSTHLRIYQQYSRTILLAATEDLPHSTFIRNGLQAICSKKNMTLDTTLTEGNELNAWIPNDPKHDIWSPRSSGDKIAALLEPINLIKEVENLVDAFLICSKRHRDVCAQRALKLGGRLRSQVDNAHRILKLFHRNEIIKAVWIRKVLLLRTHHRDLRSWKAWEQRWYREHYGTTQQDIVTLSSAAAVRKASDEARHALFRSRIVFRGHIKRLRDAHGDARFLGRMMGDALLDVAFRNYCEDAKWQTIMQAFCDFPTAEDDVLFPMAGPCDWNAYKQWEGEVWKRFMAPGPWAN